MKTRCSRRTLIAGCAMGAALMALSAPIASAQQPAPAAPATYRAPRAPDGRPDLQGYWTNLTYTPFERPKELAGKPFYTEQEAIEAFNKAVKDTFTTDQLVHYVQSDFAATPVQTGAKPNIHTSVVIDPPDGRIPAFTPEAQKRVAAIQAAGRARGPLPSTWRDDRGTQWCVFHDRAVPAIPAPYGSIYHIVQSKDFIVMTYEWNSERRVIPLDGRPHNPASVRTYTGDARGRWEGDTLVVETINFTPKRDFFGSEGTFTLVERFTRVSEDSISHTTMNSFGLWPRFIGLCLLVIVCAAPGSYLPRTYAQQARTTQDRVFTTTQATRGGVLYQERCAACHGAELEGSIGPELAGPTFLGVWGGQPLSDFFDKIEKTMPADAPGTLTRIQVADIVAYALQTNTFPAGTADLATDEGALGQIALAQRPTGATPAGAGPSLSFPAAGNLNQVMRGILFPSSNVLFDVQTQDPSSRPKPGARAEASTTSSRYGDVYEPWAVVDAAAISLAEVGPLLMTPGRRCENGKPVPVDQANWQQWVQELGAAGRAAYKASQTRDADMVSEATNQLADSCANCHRVYRDVASAAERCTPP